MRGSLAAIAAPTLRVSAMLERSARCMRWPSLGALAWSLRIVACARASSRATMTIRAPSAASSRTAASPMPDVAPVATTVLLFIQRSSAQSRRRRRYVSRPGGAVRGRPNAWPSKRRPAGQLARHVSTAIGWGYGGNDADARGRMNGQRPAGPDARRRARICRGL